MAAILNKNSNKKKLCIDLKWREMRSKVIFGHPKWPKSYHGFYFTMTRGCIRIKLSINRMVENIRLYLMGKTSLLTSTRYKNV